MGRYEYIMIQNGIHMFKNGLDKVSGPNTWKEKLLRSTKKDLFLNFLKRIDEESTKNVCDSMNSFPPEEGKKALRCHFIFKKLDMLELPKYEYVALLNLAGFTIYGYGALLLELKK